MALRSLLDGPTPPGVRGDALSNTYVIRREGDRRTVLLRRRGAEEVELASSARIGAPPWSAVARALLDDALDDRAPRRLVSDYARFLVTPRGQSRTIDGRELEQWLATWRPSILTTLSSRR